MAKAEVCKTSIHRFESDRRLTRCDVHYTIKLLRQVREACFFICAAGGYGRAYLSHRKATFFLPLCMKINTLNRLNELNAGVAELVDATDLKSVGHSCPCRFEPGPRYKILKVIFIVI